MCGRRRYASHVTCYGWTASTLIVTIPPSPRVSGPHWSDLRYIHTPQVSGVHVHMLLLRLFQIKLQMLLCSPSAVGPERSSGYRSFKRTGHVQPSGVVRNELKWLGMHPTRVEAVLQASSRPTHPQIPRPSTMQAKS